MRRSSENHPEITSWAVPTDEFVDVAQPELMRRVRAAMDLMRARSCAGAGGPAYYAGSTSDPAWRWKGGWCWRSETRAKAPATRVEWMDGHSLRWKWMVVLGAWPDVEAARLEPIAIHVARAHAGEAVENVANDARGLAVRPHPGYSFIYVCGGRR